MSIEKIHLKSIRKRSQSLNEEEHTDFSSNILQYIVQKILFQRFLYDQPRTERFKMVS